MSRTYNERKFLTEKYQKKQIDRLGPFRDYGRRPEQTFWWKIYNADQFHDFDQNVKPAPTPEQIGFFRNHNFQYCGCQQCRTIKQVEKKYPSPWSSQNYKKELINIHIIKEMKQEVIDFLTSR